MKRSQMGSLTILFTVILLCVTVLSVLSLSTARADLALADRYGDHVAQFYELESQGQQFLMQMQEAARTPGADFTDIDLPACATMQDGQILAVLEQDGLSLTIRLSVSPDTEIQILEWSRQAQWTADTNLTLW